MCTFFTIYHACGHVKRFWEYCDKSTIKTMMTGSPIRSTHSTSSRNHRHYRNRHDQLSSPSSYPSSSPLSRTSASSPTSPTSSSSSSPSLVDSSPSSSPASRRRDSLIRGREGSPTPSSRRSSHRCTRSSSPSPERKRLPTISELPVTRVARSTRSTGTQAGGTTSFRSSRVRCGNSKAVTHENANSKCKDPDCHYERVGRLWECCKCGSSANKFPFCDRVVDPDYFGDIGFLLDDEDDLGDGLMLLCCSHRVCARCSPYEFPPIPVYDPKLGDWAVSPHSAKTIAGDMVMVEGV